METRHGDAIDVHEAARILGISTEAVRKRLARKSLRGYKRGGRWFVLLSQPVSSQMDATTGQTDAAAGRLVATGVEENGEIAEAIRLFREVLEMLREEVAFLRRELQARDEELRRRDETIAALVGERSRGDRQWNGGRWVVWPWRR